MVPLQVKVGYFPSVKLQVFKNNRFLEISRKKMIEPI